MRMIKKHFTDHGLVYLTMVGVAGIGLATGYIMHCAVLGYIVTRNYCDGLKEIKHDQKNIK